MSFGVTTGKAHLDARNPVVIQPQEIDWAAFIQWQNGHSPKFAGRYFLGQPYLWAHGEGSIALEQASDLQYIAPIQRADTNRQQATGNDGEQHGRDDASAFCDYMQKCLDIGEVSIPGTSIFVFLEVADGTQISTDYWSSWCATVYDYMVISESTITAGNISIPMPKISQPFLPGICCQFSKSASGKYVPDAGVQACLDAVGKASPQTHTRCFGFWARATDIASYHAPEPNLDWSVFDAYQQPQGSASQPVWVFLWRYMVGTDPQNPEFPGADKLTLDASSEASGEDIALKTMLKVENWSSILPPSRLGVDKGRDIATEISCLARTKMKITQLPAWPGGANANISAKTSFAIRYYSTKRGAAQENRPKDLSPTEASTVSKAGVELVIVWQANVPFQNIPAYLATPGSGIDDAWNAFAEAANIVGQPPYTPVYFAIDAWTAPSPGSYQPAGAGGPVIPFLLTDQVVGYLKDVATGYQNYLVDQKNKGLEPIPYYIGVYAGSDVLDACYIQGLATHFWQAMPPNWGGTGQPGEFPNLDVWPHDDIWQVCLWMDNNQNCASQSGIGGCRDANANPAGDFVDLNASWGDVGGWKL